MPFHTIKLKNNVDIYLEKNALQYIGDICAKSVSGRRAFVVSDTNVSSLYFDFVKHNLEKSGFEVGSFFFEAGEERKRLSTVEQIYEALYNSKITRTDIIIALGGGVVGDLTGFAAATYLRGISYVQVPTSLLAQIDSSIGGKTGADLPFGKNLVGAIYQPDTIIIDTFLLKTLPEYYFTDGLCEIIKYAYIKDSAIFNLINKEITEDILTEIIKKCVLIKSLVVENDEHEKGERMILNFGHTFGHAIEKCMNFTGIGHGSAVAKGMYISLKIGEELGITKEGEAKRYLELCNTVRLNPFTDIKADDLFAAMIGDKKRQGSSINFILIEEMGKAVIHKTTIDELSKIYNRLFKI